MPEVRQYECVFTWYCLYLTTYLFRQNDTYWKELIYVVYYFRLFPLVHGILSSLQVLVCQ